MTAQDTATFETPSLIVNCFEEKAAINDLVAFFELHSERDRTVNIQRLTS